MKTTSDAWSNYRNRWCWLNGKKLKLRKYVAVSSKIMKRKNKKGWENVNHFDNYKKCLLHYGFAGIKFYEDLFYKNIPLPENRNWKVKLALFLEPIFYRFFNLKQLIINKIKNL